MIIKIGKLDTGFIGYKAASYKIWNAETYQKQTKNDKEWSGLYIVEEEHTARAFLPDMVKMGEGTAYIHTVTLLGKVKLITCLDERLKTGSADLNALKEALRQKDIDIENDQLLIPRLGELGYFFQCYNNEEGTVEIIAPVSLTADIEMSLYEHCDIEHYDVSSCDVE